MKSWLLVMLIMAGSLLTEGEEPEEEMHIGRVIRQIVFPGEQGSQGGGGGGGAGGFNQRGDCNCAPIVTCAAELDQIQGSCTLPNGVQAVCCPPRFLAASSPPTGTGDNRLFLSPRIKVDVGPLDDQGVNTACQKGVGAINNVRAKEDELVRNNIVLPRGSPAGGHRRVFKVRQSTKDTDDKAYTILMAAKNMMNDFSLTPRQGGHGLRDLRVSNTILRDRCTNEPVCHNSNSKYREIDGSCNNLAHPSWGSTDSSLQRILLPKYDDGLMEPRTRGRDGTPLPKERTIANTVLVDVDNPDQEFTSSVMQWAQFLDHDITHTPFPSMGNGADVECCPGGKEAPENLRHERCWPIDVSGDVFYAPRGQSCMNFARSMLANGRGSDCTFGYAEQVNAVTHWLDGSNVYGSNDHEEGILRTGNSGLLKTSNNDLLPYETSGRECEAELRGARCYVAGDSRVNEQPGLTAIHTIWMREHNRIARELKNYNSRWSDETLFQETRRIVVAEMQHITYNEWLPIIVGPNFMQSFGLSVRSSGYSSDYNPRFNPSINNEFATAAFRFGHTLVQGVLRLFSPTGEESTLRLRDHFNSPHLIQKSPEMIDAIARSWTQVAIQKFDSFISQELTNHLFQTPRFNFGMDLMSLNIRRGRDHGLATYNEVRVICGLPKANNFNDIKDQIPAPIADNLARVYKHVDDIDIFVGGLSERPVSGGLLGWTFLCVVGDQFARLKKGDRYFYDLGGQAGSFSEPQLQEIRRTSWARIICDNTQTVQSVQPLAFRLSGNTYNIPVSCNSPQIPSINLQRWRGERT